MSRQSSKRFRHNRHIKEFMPVLDGRSGTLLDDRLWIFRSVGGSSLSALSESTKLIKSHEAARKRGGYTLSLMYPEEVRRATQRSALRGFITVKRIADTLANALPESVYQPKVAETLGLKQYHGVIGVAVTYPEFDEERKAITSSLNDILGVDYSWDVRAHITVARGQLSRLSNMEQIEGSLPLQLNLTNAHNGLNV